MLRRHDLLAFQKLETCIFFVVVRNNEGTARHLPITDTVPGDCFGAGGCGPKAAARRLRSGRLRPRRRGVEGCGAGQCGAGGCGDWRDGESGEREGQKKALMPCLDMRAVALKIML